MLLFMIQWVSCWRHYYRAVWQRKMWPYSCTYIFVIRETIPSVKWRSSVNRSPWGYLQRESMKNVDMSHAASSTYDSCIELYPHCNKLFCSAEVEVSYILVCFFQKFYHHFASLNQKLLFPYCLTKLFIASTVKDITPWMRDFKDWTLQHIIWRESLMFYMEVSHIQKKKKAIDLLAKSTKY